MHLDLHLLVLKRYRGFQHVLPALPWQTEVLIPCIHRPRLLQILLMKTYGCSPFFCTDFIFLGSPIVWLDHLYCPKRQ